MLAHEIALTLPTKTLNPTRRYILYLEDQRPRRINAGTFKMVDLKTLGTQKWKGTNPILNNKVPTKTTAPIFPILKDKITINPDKLYTTPTKVRKTTL